MITITKATQEYLNKVLKLPAKGDEQNWDIEMADKNRLMEFINAFKNNYFAIEQKYAVVALILASYEDYLNNFIDVNEKIWLQIVKIIELDKGQYNDLLNYWALSGEKSSDLYSITLKVRKYIFKK